MSDDEQRGDSGAEGRESEAEMNVLDEANGDERESPDAEADVKERSKSPKRRRRSRSRSAYALDDGDGEKGPSFRSPKRHRKSRHHSRSRSRSPQRHRRRRSGSREERHSSSHRSRASGGGGRGDGGYDSRRHFGSRVPVGREEAFSTRSRLQEEPPPNRCIGVFGLSLYTTEKDLKEYFGRFGPIEEVQLVYDHPTGRSRGFGFIYYENKEDAVEVGGASHEAALEPLMQAKEQAAGIELDGHRIRVDFSITKRAHTPTPGIYMGKPGSGRHERDDYNGRGGGREPSPYGGGGRGGGGGGGGYSRGRRSRSRSYSPRRTDDRYYY